jgi:peptidyl-dipeptidase Dcp
LHEVDAMSANPLLAEWSTPFGVPPFADIRPEHFPPAFDAAFSAHENEVAAIAADARPPDFANTVEAMERAGELLDRVSATFWNLASADTNDALQAIEREVSPRTAKHFTAIYMNEALFRRFEAVWEARDAVGLAGEKLRVLERYRTSFLRAGVQLASREKTRLAEIVQRLSTLGTAFSQNVLADEKAYALVLESDADLAGLPDFLVTGMGRAAADRGRPGKYAVTLSRSIIEPFLTFSTRRDLREAAFKAWIARGESGGTTDNRAIVAEMLALRAERAALLGFPSFAHFKLDDAMAKTPARVRELLEAVWRPAVAKAARERDDLQATVERDGGNFAIEPWDWRHYAEKLRKARYDLDEAEVKPYFALDAMIEAAFDTASRLFGLSFTRREDVPVYRPGVRAWEVTDRHGAHVGLFLGDYFARPSKRSGAWMSSFRTQEKLAGDVRPIIVNVMNFAEPAEGSPALLSFDDARTLFHEFGHALHGLLSDVTYSRLAGTAVSSDFVELPSQLYEHWLERPEILGRFARHAETGRPIPDRLIEKLRAARTFNQGFATVEYASSALVDLAFHMLPSAAGVDPFAFERQTLEGIGMPREITMRHRTPHFSHVFSGDGYSAGYYSYLWSEVLDADAFRAFLEAGDPFDAATADRLKRFIYAAGNTRPPDEAYVAFRGRLPTIDALLEKRGLV